MEKKVKRRRRTTGGKDKTRRGRKEKVKIRKGGNRKRRDKE